MFRQEKEAPKEEVKPPEDPAPWSSLFLSVGFSWKIDGSHNPHQDLSIRNLDFTNYNSGLNDKNMIFDRQIIREIIRKNVQISSSKFWIWNLINKKCI